MKDSNFIKDTMRFVSMMFILVILVDCTQFDIQLRKEKYSILNSFINVVGYGKQVVKTVRRVW